MSEHLTVQCELEMNPATLNLHTCSLHPSEKGGKEREGERGEGERKSSAAILKKKLIKLMILDCGGDR